MFVEKLGHPKRAKKLGEMEMIIRDWEADLRDYHANRGARLQVG